MSLKEFIFSDEFSIYRKSQVEAIVLVIKDSLLNDPASVKGQFEMARRILNVPSKLIDDEKVNVQLNSLLIADFQRVYEELARQGILEE